jgi:CDP-diacylglycerol--glycerol-3-phosphate 3-phosphatidyltransferase
MASIYDLKPAFQDLLRPIMRGLARMGATPNAVTVAALVMSAAVGSCIAWQPNARWPLVVLPAALFVRMALNALDGMMARELNMASNTGAVLNEVGDVISDTVLYLPLAMVPGLREDFVVAAVILAVISEMTGVVAVQIGASRRYDGPMGKSDRAFLFGALALALGLGVPSGLWVEYVMGAMVLLLLVTIYNRARRALRETG